MPWKAASNITISKKQERILTEHAVGTHTPLHLKTRSQIILHASKGCSNNSIEKQMGIDAKTVKLWRDRYSREYEELRRIEAEVPHKIRSAIKRLLSDEQRPGRSATFTDEQVAAIIAMACQAPEKLGVPCSHWTPGLLQIEVINRGIVSSISVRQIGRFLKRQRPPAASQPKLAES
jgi:putative transposase